MEIDFVKDSYRFTTRASAIIFNKDKTKVLLFKVEDGRDYFLLPGGRIEFGEDSKSAIKREIIEELGYDIDFNICSIQENFIDNNKNNMQYCFCYTGIYDGEITKEKIECNDQDRQSFYWVDVAKIDKYKILPKSVYTSIHSSGEIEHFVEKITV